MYLVVWLDGPRVRICGPLLRRLNAAIAVLNSYRRDDAPGMIFCGDEIRLRGFCQALESRDLGDSVPAMLAAIHRVARETRVSTVKATVARVTTVPRAKSYPRHISPQGKPLWDQMIKQHQQMIRKYGDKERQWAAALILYQRFAEAAGVEPFKKLKTTEDKLRKASQDDIRKKVQMGGMRAGKLLDDFVAAVDPLVLRVKDEQFYEAARERDAFFLTTQYPLILKRGTPPVTVINQGIAAGWAGVEGRYVHRAVDRMTHLLIEPRGPQLVAYVAAQLTRDQVILIFEFPDEVSDPELIKGVEKAGRRWVRSGRMTWTAR